MTATSSTHYQGDPENMSTASNTGGDGVAVSVSPNGTPYDKFQLLQCICANQTHGPKTTKLFYQHLKDVHDYLQKQGASQEVCDAGLFHSIYGTEFFEPEPGTTNHVTREVIRALIGEYAEHLVWVFCTTKNRFEIFTQHPNRKLERRFQRDLCTVEFANLRDQNRGGKFREKLVRLAEVIQRLEGEMGEGRGDENLETPEGPPPEREVE
jgi:hypothetical protein